MASEMQEKLYAQDRWALLLIFQGMDAAGKDGAIKHVMSGVNPQGCDVYSFKTPTNEELDHDFLWRCHKVMPERGKIGIFNRSYYEEVLVVRVHPQLLKTERLPDRTGDQAHLEERYEDINAFERYLTRNGVVIRKFFLHISKEEQKKRFLERLEDSKKNWKFSMDGHQGARILERLPGGVRGDGAEHGHQARAVVRGSRGQQMVYAAGGGVGDRRGAGRIGSGVSGRG